MINQINRAKLTRVTLRTREFWKHTSADHEGVTRKVGVGVGGGSVERDLKGG